MFAGGDDSMFPGHLDAISISAMSRHLHRLRTSWLLLLDNANSWDMLTSHFSQWRSLLPRVGSYGHCLIVTRSSCLPAELESLVSEIHHVSPLSADAALAFFFARAKLNLLSPALPGSENYVLSDKDGRAPCQLVASTEQWQRVAEKYLGPTGLLSGNPAAIEIAAAYVKNMELRNHTCGQALACTVADVLHELLDFSGSAGAVEEADSCQTEGTHCVLLKALQQLLASVMYEISPAAKELLLMLAYFNPNCIDFDLLMSAAARENLPPRLRKALESNMKHGLHSILCELRWHSLVNFGPSCQPRWTFSHPRNGQQTLGTVQPDSTSSLCFSLPRLVQEAVRLYISRDQDLWLSSMLDSDQNCCVPVFSFWSSAALSCCRVLSATAICQSRVRNQFNALPHMLELYEIGMQGMKQLLSEDDGLIAGYLESSFKPLPHCQRNLQLHVDAGASSGALVCDGDPCVWLHWLSLMKGVSDLVRMKHAFLPSAETWGPALNMAQLCHCSSIFSSASDRKEWVDTLRQILLDGCFAAEVHSDLLKFCKFAEILSRIPRRGHIFVLQYLLVCALHAGFFEMTTDMWLSDTKPWLFRRLEFWFCTPDIDLAHNMCFISPVIDAAAACNILARHLGELVATAVLGCDSLQSSENICDCMLYLEHFIWLVAKHSEIFPFGRVEDLGMLRGKYMGLREPQWPLPPSSGEHPHSCWTDVSGLDIRLLSFQHCVLAHSNLPSKAIFTPIMFLLGFYFFVVCCRETLANLGVLECCVVCERLVTILSNADLYGPPLAHAMSTIFSSVLGQHQKLLVAQCLPHLCSALPFSIAQEEILD